MSKTHEDRGGNVEVATKILTLADSEQVMNVIGARGVGRGLRHKHISPEAGVTAAAPAKAKDFL